MAMDRGLQYEFVTSGAKLIPSGSESRGVRATTAGRELLRGSFHDGTAVNTQRRLLWTARRAELSRRRTSSSAAKSGPILRHAPAPASTFAHDAATFSHRCRRISSDPCWTSARKEQSGRSDSHPQGWGLLLACRGESGPRTSRGAPSTSLSARAWTTNRRLPHRRHKREECARKTPSLLGALRLLKNTNARTARPHGQQPGSWSEGIR